MNEQYGIPQLLELVRDIEKNPSQVHGGSKHSDFPQTSSDPPDFDWNVFVTRLDKMIQEEKVINSPFRQVRLALDCLSADLTYDNRDRAKKLLHNVTDTLELREKKDREFDQEDRALIEEEQAMFLVSSTLDTDEFWQKAAKSSHRCKCQCPGCQYRSEEKPEEERSEEKSEVLQEEKLRYMMLRNRFLVQV